MSAPLWKWWLHLLIRRIFVSPLKLGSTLFSCRNATISKTIQSDSAKRVQSRQQSFKSSFFVWFEAEKKASCAQTSRSPLVFFPQWQKQRQWLTFVGAVFSSSLRLHGDFMCPLSAPWTLKSSSLLLVRQECSLAFALSRSFAQKTLQPPPSPPGAEWLLKQKSH